MRALLATLTLAAVLTGAAAAATIRGTPRGELLRGTARADLILAGGGRDTVLAGGGDDRVAVHYDRARDRVRCGRGRDLVAADRADVIATDCELVSRLVSRDVYTNPESQHESQVEPSAFAAGSTIVTAFQSGRRREGGAANIGFSTSTDGGRTWRDGGLPGLSVNSSPPGDARFVSDPVVAYDATHGTWLISTLALGAGRTELTISRSADGLRWEAPVVAARFLGNRLGYDKNWAACDNWPASPHRGRCYLAYTDLTGETPLVAVQVSDDGGASWSAPATVAADDPSGVIPLPRPDGSLVIPYLDADAVEAVTSSDGGATLGAPVRVAAARARFVPGLRLPPLPSADVDTLGRVYVAWHDCSLRPACDANDIVISTSSDGSAWAAPVRATGAAGGLVPALAVERSSGRLALVYHRCAGAECRIDVVAATSADGGRTWSRTQLLTPEPMRPEWLPITSGGRMLGDYIALAWSAGRPVAVFALASPPARGTLRQAIAAARLR